MASKKKSAKRGRKSAKRGAPYGNQNARKKQGTRRRNRAGSEMVVVSDADVGGEGDPVLMGFQRKEEQLRAEFEDLMAGIEAGRNAYKANLGNARMLNTTQGTGKTPAHVSIKLTRKGTPDMRNRTTREFMKEHPEWVPPSTAGIAPLADGPARQ